MQDLSAFWSFLKEYLKSKLIAAGHNIEGFKNIIVAFLIVKRGKYSSSFLNTSFLLLVVAAFIGGPIIAENNPFVSSASSSSEYQASIVSYNPYENSLETVVSAKPRDKIIEYEVKGGDTLISVARRFDVSIETIKWVNDLTSDVIKPRQILKVPPITGVVHKVSSGDNVYTIAKKYRTDAQKIVNFPFNEFNDLDTFSLTPGQVLYVPDGTIEAAPKAAPSRFVAQIQAGVRGSSTFIWPTSGSVSQYPVWYHMALDVQNPAAPPVIAADSGTVTFAGCSGYGYGCHIIVNHGNGFETLYAHLSGIGVSPGQAVGQGQGIGTMGSTGRSTGTHLHFEIRQGGVLLNPLGFLR